MPYATNFSMGDVAGANAIPNTRPPTFQEQFMQAFAAGLVMKKQQADIAAQQEERDYLKKYHQHQIKTLDLEDLARQLKGRTDAAQMYSGYGGGDTPTFDFSGFEALGVPSGLKYKPPTMAEVLARKQQEKNLEENVNVTPEIAARFGTDLPAGSYPKPLLDPIIKSIMDKVDIPGIPGLNLPGAIPTSPGGGPPAPPAINLPPGQYDKEALTSIMPTLLEMFKSSTVPAATTFTQGQETGRTQFIQGETNKRTGAEISAANQRAREQNQTTLDAAKLRTGGGEPGSIADQSSIKIYANQVRSNPGFLRSLPVGVRLPVLRELGFSGQAIMSPAVQEKLDQFIPAEAALDDLDKATQEFADPNAGVVDKAVSGIKLHAKIGAFSRLVGRATGEKGVFTDQDAANFKDYIAPFGVAGAAVDPKMTLTSIQNAKALMEEIKQRLVGGQTQRQYPAGPAARPSPAAGGGKPIVQHNTDTGQYRYSTDGGATWKMGLPPGGGQ